ncbi:ATP-binding protein [Bradyrhizobium sp. Tv2a-2]|uniref:sensor histidine kinase n=1 Tax=Bradyrhizobium sp. Tv2a-2 TaxID=113395 RepID=UPI001FD99F00|nr:ATP-binding protein [Bradyrhizobium sp. Tv2a-2]
MLEQSDVRSSFYADIFAGIRDEASARGQSHATIYAENLDLARFRDPQYEGSLVEHFRTKYADHPIGVIVAIGVDSLRFLQRSKATLWHDVPVVFGFVPDQPETRALLSPDTTGTFANVTLAQMIAAARAAAPDLTRIVLVGEAWKDPAIFGHWKDEMPEAGVDLAVTDLSGVNMQELRRRVAALPAQSAIIYSAIYSDGEGTFYSPAHALELVAQTANRPIVIASETFLGRGAIGGFLLLPGVIGHDAGRQAMRVLAGEPVPNIPLSAGDNVRPIFDWRQLQRWQVAESGLPQGSEIRFRTPTIVEQYRWQSLTAVAIILIQALLITGMLYERQRRHLAEIEARSRMSELAHLNRRATAGEMTASIAHELNQPLAAILSNAEAAESLLKRPSPDLAEIGEILLDIRRDDERASGVIKHLRSLLKKGEFEAELIDINDTVRDVFQFLAVQALVRGVKLETDLAGTVLHVWGDRIELEQVVLNLAMNAMDAAEQQPKERRRVIGRTEPGNGKSVVVSVVDFGQGIPAERLARVFDPFFTTKEQGMGVGLSIARTIVEMHRGRIWADQRPGGGAVFFVSLPLASADKGRTK